MENIHIFVFRLLIGERRKINRLGSNILISWGSISGLSNFFR